MISAASAQPAFNRRRHGTVSTGAMKKSEQRGDDALRESRGRTIALVTAVALVALPAGIMRAFCVGKACDSNESAPATVPFCSLPADTRSLVAAGYREGRSPNVLAVAGPGGVAGAQGLGSAPWPEIDSGAAAVPIVFHGTGVDPTGEVPAGTTLDRIAPTVAEIIELRRAHPEVRSGTAISEIATAQPPRLVLEVVLKGAGSSTVETNWPELKRMMGSGAATLRGSVPSLPLDPTAAIATIGTGGLPRQHGITGTHVRSDSGKLVEAWSRGAPPSVIATLPDDLDQRLRGRPHIGLVADSPTDRGLIGGNWYVDNDEDDIVITKDVVRAGKGLLARGYGRDDVTDLLAVTLAADAASRDEELGALVKAAAAASDDSLLTVVTATGASEPAPQMIKTRGLSNKLEVELGTDVVEAFAVGGLFIDQGVLARNKISEDEVVRSLRALETVGGRPILADAFTGIAVSFARYC
jgi:hypothetical protein